MDTTCINCPMGCSLHIEKVGDEIKVSGNTCKRGEIYGKSEFTSPVRMVTSLVSYMDGVTSVKTSKPVSKALIFKVLEEIKKIHVTEQKKCGDIIAKDIAASGADLIITGNL